MRRLFAQLPCPRACPDGRKRQCRQFASGQILAAAETPRCNMLEREGFRPDVGIILLNTQNEVWWGKRVREHSWQFPQGGIKFGETPEQALYRELEEEVGLKSNHVK